MDATARLRRSRSPVLTLSICAASVVVAVTPRLQGMLIYDRAAVASGEWWRLITGNLVHLSAEQLFYDLTVFLIAGWMIEAYRIHHFPRLCLLSTALIGIGIYLFMPEMAYYAGLSGVATGAVAFLCLDGLRTGGVWRWLCMAVLIGLLAKVGVEIISDRFLVLSIDVPHIVPAPISHAIGTATAVFLFALNHRIGLRRSPSEITGSI